MIFGLWIDDIKTMWHIQRMVTRELKVSFCAYSMYWILLKLQFLDIKDRLFVFGGLECLKMTCHIPHLLCFDLPIFRCGFLIFGLWEDYFKTMCHGWWPMTLKIDWNSPFQFTVIKEFWNLAFEFLSVCLHKIPPELFNDSAHSFRLKKIKLTLFK